MEKEKEKEMQKEDFDKCDFDKVLEHADFARLIVMNRGEVKIIPVCFELEECRCRGLHFKLKSEALERIALRKGDCVILEFEAKFCDKLIIVIVKGEVCHIEDEEKKCCCDKDKKIIVKAKDIDVDVFEDVDCD